ncbi:hypothetical protein [Hymenobacter sp. PAMC 26628]|uniref:hypothetical protein n=1 Tax=Hymenobacter sp. PAMC 26628 TaxID=1484118 RepID=UPI0007701409|nr:hypothetical protein [Hymenobacter sp. PAMC 26628]AMJ64344.1 hypothetical protein AXW84_02055 [Hymenobacter sp. PAMC 26628]
MHSARFSTLVLALGLAASGCSVFHKRAKAPITEAGPAAAAPTPATAARDLADAMATVLKLTPDQTSRIRTVLNGTVEQANAAKQQHPAQSPELAAALKHINIASQTQLQQIMGAAKYREFKAKQARVQAEMARQ